MAQCNDCSNTARHDSPYCGPCGDRHDREDDRDRTIANWRHDLDQARYTGDIYAVISVLDALVDYIEEKEL